MKKLISVICLIALLLGLIACGGEGSEDAVSDEAVSTVDVSVVENSSGYEIPSGFINESVNDGTWGYITEASSIPDGSYSMEPECLTMWETEGDTDILVKLSLFGEELCRLTIPRQETENSVSAAISYYCFGEACVWLIYDNYILVDEDSGEVKLESRLQQWSLEGQLLQEHNLSDYVSGDEFVTDMALDDDGDPVLATLSKLLFLEDDGHTVVESEIGDVSYSFVRDRDGRLYLYDFFENKLSAVDWENHAPGETVLTMEQSGGFYPGGGDYDFFLCSELTLSGISLSTGTITEILSWDDWDLSSSVGGVAWLDEETFLIRTSGILLDIYPVLLLKRVPAGEIQEKTVVRMAVPLNATWEDATWTDTVDRKIVEMITIFNRSSAQYRVEVETFSSATELNLKFASGDSPDLIYWSYTAWLDEPASANLLAKRGYLEDMEPLFAADEEANLSNFIPNLVELVKERDGGLYSMPLSFYFTGATALEEYVGDDPTWTIAEMVELQENLPEDMTIFGNSIQSSMLDTLLNDNLTAFVDMNTGECDFMNQDFYDILNFCRDNFPAEFSEDSAGSSGNSLLMGVISADLYSELPELEAQGKVLVGYPGVEGNGMSAVIFDECSLCAMGQNKEAAWEFIKTLYTYEFQYAYSGLFISVRDDVFNDMEDWRLTNNDRFTPELSAEFRQLVYGIETLKILDSPVLPIIREEAAAFFAGDKTAEQVAEIIENRVKIYLSEQA